MEKNYMNSDSLVELEFLTGQKMGIHYHENIELLFMMNGKLAVTVEDDEFCLDPGDIIVINANRNHSYKGDGELFAGRFLISYSKISELLGTGSILFWCNSAMDDNGAYDELRAVISRIFSQYLKGDKGRGRGKIYLNSLHYQMLSILVRDFLLTEDDARFESGKAEKDDRVQEIFSYIRLNYRRNICLQDIAEQLCLSQTYISKYIKSKCNSSFVELINSVRLGHAMEDLLYTEASVMKIAMDNGFASVAAYNKVFKSAYGATPSEFRKNMRSKTEKDNPRHKQIQEQIHSKVEAYLVRNPVKEQEEKCKRDIYAAADTTSDCGTWENNCGRMINVGTALDLTKTAFREQILAVRDRLGVEYVRFWDIYDPELFIDLHAPAGHMHFGKLDTVTDFLVKNNMKPYIELGFKPLRLLKNAQNALKEIPRGQEFFSDQEMWDFYNGMMRHFVKRYGYEEVEQWYFEYWEKEETEFYNLSYKFSPLSEEEHEKYFHRFDILANALRSCIPGIKIGGGGFPLQHYGKKEFSKMLVLWKKHKEMPDFISLSCYPYHLEKEENVYYEKRSADVDFVMHNLELAESAAGDTLFPTTDIYVSEYSMTLSNRNAMNDSCVKGAFLIRNAISCIGKTHLLGHWLFTDAYADFNDAQNLLFGGCGILNKNGIPKPAFYAFEFLHSLYRRIVAKGQNFLVTENDRGSFCIVCHNFKDFNYNYYLVQENEIQIKDIPLMIDNRELLTLHFDIDHVKNGTYIMKQRKINQSSGSIQDEWGQLNMEPELTMEELEYLKKVNTARLFIQELTADDNRLKFDILLEANEIQHLYISHSIN